MKWYLLIAAALLLASCDKGLEYNISGVVFDVSANKPLEGAYCRLDLLRKDSGRSIDVGNQTVYTDSTGAYTLSLSAEDADYCVFRVGKAGHIEYSQDFEHSLNEVIDIDIHRFDSFIEMEFENTSPTDTRAVFYRLRYAVTDEGLNNSKSVAPLGKARVVASAPGEVETTVEYWAYDNDKNKVKKVVICPRGDTAKVQLPY